VRYTRGRDGRLATDGNEAVMRAGEVTAVSPTIGDIHAVANALDDGTSISIHVYGANIGAVGRHVFDSQTGAIKPFVSGYSSPLVPNLWDRSAATRAALAG
jgi:predicted metal-dependent enzyme (double-stranded beta helix superfamily)